MKSKNISKAKLASVNFVESAGRRPELMVLGNSLAQGVQTLTFHHELANQCVGARLAGFNAWDFRPADHEKPILLDFEEELRQLDIFDLITAPAYADDLAKRINENIRWWQGRIFQAPAPHPGFDNVAVAQALIRDLFIPAGEWRNRLRELIDGYILTGDQLLGMRNLSPLFDIYEAINFAYTLNPGNEDAKQGWSAIDWVRQARPKRILVTIGHNEGLYRVGFNGAATLINYSQLEGLEELARQISTCEVEQVIWDLLPKIGAVASLEPLGTWSIPADHNHTAYADNYRAIITGGTVSGHDLKAIDDSIQATNQMIRNRTGAIFKQANKRIEFFDDYEVLDALDFKNEPLKTTAKAQKKRLAVPVQAGGKTRSFYADNRYIYEDYRPDPGWSRRSPAPGILTLVQGGLFSGDGMHASGLGYMLKALRLQSQLGLPTPVTSTWLGKAYEECHFLSHFPTDINTLRLILGSIRGGGTAGSSIADASLAKTQEDKTAMVLGQLMKSVIR